MKPLFKILHRSMLVNSLIPLLIIEMALLALYFGINQYSSSKNQQILLTQVLTNIEQTNQYKAHSITLTLNEINHLSSIIGNAQQRFFETFGSCDEPLDTPDYVVGESGVFYNPVDNGGTSLYVSSSTELTEQTRKKAICSASLDPLLKEAVKNTPTVTQAYLNMWDDIVRIYPYIENIPEKLGPTLNLQDFNFYYEADQAHNPLRDTVWTKAYLDPAGQGWMVSAIYPIYHNGFLEGVGGLDITLHNFIEDILRIQLPSYATAIMLDKDGTILAMPKQAEDLVGLNQEVGYDYKDLLTQTIERPDEFNITKNPNTDFSQLYHQLVYSEHPYIEGEINGKPYFMFIDAISYTKWQLVMLIDKQQALEPIAEMKSLTTQFGWVAVSTVIIFYTLFFIYLKTKSFKLSSAVAYPLEVLSEQTKNIKHHIPLDKLPQTEIKELQQLNENFSIMQSTLRTQTQELISAEVKQRLMEKEKELLTRLANTDPLTQAANRLKIEEALEHEIKLSRRYQHTLSIIMIDIDFFKKVNDNFGHDMGDQVLVQCVNIMQENLRETDLLGRWGGEEFIVICRHATLSEGKHVAEHLRKSIEKAHFATNEQVTASFGIACYHHEESNLQLVDRADRALYEAKQQGRNRCVGYEVDHLGSLVVSELP